MSSWGVQKFEELSIFCQPKKHQRAFRNIIQCTSARVLLRTHESFTAKQCAKHRSPGYAQVMLTKKLIRISLANNSVVNLCINNPELSGASFLFFEVSIFKPILLKTSAFSWLERIIYFSNMLRTAFLEYTNYFVFVYRAEMLTLKITIFLQ